MQIENIVIYKQLEFPAAVISNIIVDGLLGYNYSFANAQNIAEDIMQGKTFSDKRKDISISKSAVVEAMRLYSARNTEIEIEMLSDSPEEIFKIMRENAVFL